jgi:hypothetical protein
MSRELAHAFVRHIQKRKISDSSVGQYISSVLKILKSMKELGAIQMIQSFEDIENMPNWKDLALDQVYTHSGDRSAW